LVSQWKTSQANFGEQDPARWEAFVKWMQDAGLLSTDVQATDAFTNEYIK
jgi:hypothetical protein